MSLTKVQTVFGKYRLIAELGQGGMANVYLAVVRGPAGFNKLQVIKQLRSHLAEAPEFLSMFLDEARLAARLNHPNVVQTNEVGDHDGQYFIAMEYLDGQPLDRVIRRSANRGGLPLTAYVRILVDVLSGLHHAHELCDYDGTPLDVVHRDVTPHNVFITYEGQIKLVDFGIAKAANGSAETRTGVLKGKIAYMSPEQARGEDVDRRTDVFSVGLMLFEAVTGARPWTGRNDIYILNRLATEGVPKVRTVKPDVDPELEEIVDRALSFDIKDRQATAAELQGQLERFLEARAARVSPRDIGKLVADLFDDKRREMKTVLDAQLRDLSTTVSGESPLVRLPTYEGSTSASTPHSGPRQLASSPDSVIPPGGATPMVHTTSPEHIVATSQPPVPLPMPRRSWPLAVAGMIGAVIVAGGFFAYLGSRGPDRAAEAVPPVASSAAASPSSSTPSVPASPPPMDMRVRVNPADARLTLDGSPVGGSPFSTRVLRDGSAHVLKAEAPGFLPHTESILYSAPVDLEIVLDPEERGRGPRASGGPPPTSTTATGKKPRVTLDKDDPWAK